jgi:CHAD domain-containing protein
MVESETKVTTATPASDTEGRAAGSPRRLDEIIGAQFEALRAYHRAVLETQEVESIHKMRVTTRRLQAALDLLGTEKKVRAMKKRLRRWRRELSRVRNYDVFLILLEKESQTRRSAHREQFETVKGIFQKRRARRAEKVRAYLEKIDIEGLAAKLGLATARDVAEGKGEEEGGDIKERAPEAREHKRFNFDQSRIANHAADRLDQRVAEFHALASAAHPTTDPAELHELRIAAKRVRYLMEIVTEMGYGDATSPLRWLRTLQDRIGDWHDLHALEEEIIEIVSRQRFMREHLGESSRMLQAASHLQSKKEVLMSRLFPVRVPKNLALISQRLSRSLRGRTRQPRRATAARQD